MRKGLLLIVLIVIGVTGYSQAVQTHPRLWIRQQDLASIRAKAVPGNPYYAVLQNFAEELVSETNGDDFNDQFTGQYSEYSRYPAETTAMVLAFMSLLTDGAESDGYATRAHDIVMRIINEAVKGQDENEPFRDPSYAVFDRSRWSMFGIPLAVDWAYQKFTTQDKQKIRTVFLRWCDENTHATTTTDNHPEPLEADGEHPVKLSDDLFENDRTDAKSRHRVRYSSNNYYQAHFRNIYMMAAALNNEDDPGGELHAYIDDVTGAWLYVTEEYMKNEGRGGLSAEGFLYGPSAFGRLAQTLLAIYTSGEANPVDPMRGERSTFNTDFWNEVLPALFHSISPVSYSEHPWSYDGDIYVPFNYGDIQRFKVESYIDLLGPLAWYDIITGSNPDRINAIKWLQMYMPQGGRESMEERFGYYEGFFEQSILYFLVFDPQDEPTDPRPSLPTTWYAQGIGRFLSRTSWAEDATAFTFKCGFNRIDHQLADGLSFSFYRKGAFLTSELNGYGYDIGVSSSHNSLALQNNDPDGDYTVDIAYKYGSQWFMSAEGEGNITAWSDNSDYLYATGDATGLYIFKNEWTDITGDDITHASRSIVWLKPDHIIMYDRAVSKTGNRYKQYWLGLPAPAQVSGKTATVNVPNEQYLYIRNLLPSNAKLYSKKYTHDGDNGYDEPAENDPMKARLMIQDPEHPKDVRFLNVLQGRDTEDSPLFTSLIKATDNTYQGAVVANVALMFKHDLSQPFNTFSFTAPQQVTTYMITGLSPSTTYNVQISDQPNGTHLVTVSNGTGTMSDTGGVIVVGSLTLDETLVADPEQSIFPNPVMDQLSIKGMYIIHKVTITDLNGREVLNFTGGDAYEQTIDLSALPQGAYIVSVHDEVSVRKEKIIKM